VDTTATVLLESWDRNADIVNRLAAIIDDSVKELKPSDDGWTIAFHLAHMHEVRYSWLNEVSKEHAKVLGDVYYEKDGKWHVIEDLAEIKRQLALSGKVVGDAVRELIASGAGKVGPYDHPIFYLQHMLWHDGWHYGLISLALRLAGKAPTDEWEELNVWGIWRDPEI
jgi:uncharacterized damage-inducible protein DinB